MLRESRIQEECEVRKRRAKGMHNRRCSHDFFNLSFRRSTLEHISVLRLRIKWGHFLFAQNSSALWHQRNMTLRKGVEVFSTLHCNLQLNSNCRSWITKRFEALSTLQLNLNTSGGKGRFHLRFSGIRPLRGSPPPPLNGKSVWKKKVFFLSGKGGYPHPPLNGKSTMLFREIFY